MNQEQPLDDFKRDLARWLDADDAPAPDDRSAWQRRLGSVGLLAPAWKPEHGGLGLDRERNKLVDVALRERGIAPPPNGGLTMLAPVMLEYANEAQLARFLPGIAKGEINWAQGYSEPQAGSDLANVQMRCEDKGDHYLVNGQKIWTSGADNSEWIFCLVRTDFQASKHDGISFLLVELSSPGIEVSPIVLISGRSPFCQVFFTDVEVPKENLIGGPGRGWPIAKRLLQHERSMLGSGGLASLTGKAGRKSLAEVAREQIGVDDTGALRDDAFRIRVARQWTAEHANRLTGRRARGADAARVSSILKLSSSEASQQRYSLLMDLLGAEGLAWTMEGAAEGPSIPRQWLRSRANTIEGGTSEVQLDIIAKRVLGLSNLQAGSPEQALSTDEDQSMIREGALQYFDEVQPIAHLRALRDGQGNESVDAGLWSGLCELGWPGLLAPESVDGAGLGFQEMGVVFEALGRHVVASPMLSTGVLAASALSLVEGWSADAAALATGARRATVALEEQARFAPERIETIARRVDGGFVLDGAKRNVLDAGDADELLVVARVDGEPGQVGVFRVPVDADGVGVTLRRWFDGRRAGEVALEAVRVDASALVGKPVALETLVSALVDRGSAILAAELTGVAAEALARTVAYLKEREQFDQKLAEFQSLQHRCARLFSDVERTISLVQAALKAIDEGADDVSSLASGAKAMASETARLVTEEALQLYGGLGQTEEEDIGLFFKRARVSSVLFGDATDHYRRIARASGY